MRLRFLHQIGSVYQSSWKSGNFNFSPLNWAILPSFSPSKPPEVRPRVFFLDSNSVSYKDVYQLSLLASFIKILGTNFLYEGKCYF